MNINSKKIEQYCINYSIEESEILKKVKEYTLKSEVAPQMICGPLIGGVLDFLIKISKKNYTHMSANVRKDLTHKHYTL